MSVTTQSLKFRTWGNPIFGLDGIKRELGRTLWANGGKIRSNAPPLLWYGPDGRAADMEQERTGFSIVEMRIETLHYPATISGVRWRSGMPPRVRRSVTSLLHLRNGKKCFPFSSVFCQTDPAGSEMWSGPWNNKQFHEKEYGESRSTVLMNIFS